MSSVHHGLDVRIFLKECVSLAESGYETHLVITASAADVVTAAAKKVILHPLSPPRGRLARMVKQAWSCYRIARKVDADIYHFHDPELIPYGILLKLAGRPVIYDVHEDLPRDILDKKWIPIWARNLVAIAAAAMEYVSARWIFSIVTATPFIAGRFKRITPKSIDINNYPIPDELVIGGGPRIRRRQVCYVGGITEVRGIEPLIRALPLAPNVTLALCGRFQESGFEAAMRALPGWAQVDYRGQTDRDGVRQVLSESMAGMVTFLPVSNHIDAQPNKMFEYMSAEVPVIASDFPLWRKIIDGAQAGICVDPQSSQAIASAIRELVKNPVKVEKMGEAGRRAVLEKYNWPNEAKKLIEFYKGLL